MGSSEAVSGIIADVELVAGTDFTVLITGETGSGKELVAREIHRRSRRASGPFVPVDCGSMPPTLIESELFGHEKGSFTGADITRVGKFEISSGGTLFLDEISNLPLAVQAKLLRALQERQVFRVGGNRCIEVDIRVIAATNQDLTRLVYSSRFRRDLYHRLNEFSIAVPPLRERRDDIAVLARRFLEETNAELGKNVCDLAADALDLLLDYDWPGNVRELRNAIRRAVLLAGDTIALEHLLISRARPGAEPAAPERAREFDGSVPFREMVRRASPKRSNA